MGTVVINLRHTRSYDVYVGRGYKYGNPFVVDVDGTREECCEKHFEWLLQWILHKSEIVIGVLSNKWVCEHLKELRGQRLACFCKPELCHADTLAWLAEHYMEPNFGVECYDGNWYMKGQPVAVKKRKKKKKAHTITDKPVISDGNFAMANNGQLGNRVFVSMAKTINLGNYESVRVEYGFGRVVEDGQRFDEVSKACHDDAVSSLHDMVTMVEGQLKDKR